MFQSTFILVLTKQVFFFFFKVVVFLVMKFTTFINHTQQIFSKMTALARSENVLSSDLCTNIISKWENACKILNYKVLNI